MYVTITKYPYLMLDCERRAEMERLTYEIMDGGMVTDKENVKEFEIEDWVTVYAGNAVFRLAEYEDTGLTPEQIMELKERDTVKSVCHYHEEEKFRAYCPTCKRYLGIDFKEGYRGPKNTFCPGCGQRVKWED